jgi:hypothetical protein
MNVADFPTALNTSIILDSVSGFATTVANAIINDYLKAKTYILMKIKEEWIEVKPEIK